MIKSIFGLFLRYALLLQHDEGPGVRQANAAVVRDGHQGRAAGRGLPDLREEAGLL